MKKLRIEIKIHYIVKGSENFGFLSLLQYSVFKITY